MAIVGPVGAAPRHPSAAPAAVGDAPDGSIAYALDLREMPTLAQIIPRLDRARVVFVGETHDRLDHHLNQLEVVKRLHARRRAVAIGMEFFQQPFQEALDDYVAGRISERELLVRTEYFDRWRFDFRLYRPILEYARTNGIPLVALNVPVEVTSKVGRSGLDSLTEAERAAVPAEIDRGDSGYEDRLRAIYEQHPRAGDQAFERWMDVQLLWDEGMAERAARYLAENPDRTLIVLAGSGHLVHRSGIPNRVARRTGSAGMVLLPADSAPVAPELADFLLTSGAQTLPPAGRLGAMLATEDARVVITAFAPGSAAQEAGIREGDQIVAIDGIPVASVADVKVALTDKSPGDPVQVEVRRRRWLGPDEALNVAVTLR